VLGSGLVMLRVRQKNNKGRPAHSEFHGRPLAGLVQVAHLTATAAGELHPEDHESLVELIVGFCDGVANPGEVTVHLEACDEALARDGYDTCINGVLCNLPSREPRRHALLCGAVVLGSCEPPLGPHEGELFVALAIALGFSREETLDLLDEAGKLYV